AFSQNLNSSKSGVSAVGRWPSGRIFWKTPPIDQKREQWKSQGSAGPTIAADTGTGNAVRSGDVSPPREITVDEPPRGGRLTKRSDEHTPVRCLVR
ncbi:hypothetical protein, partial [Haloarcula vallismortis]|uniref:hypothetical protein n=1 Tax=Haloarcula vallismortis TaxID=28442 RepID=UPI0019D351D1